MTTFENIVNRKSDLCDFHVYRGKRLPHKKKFSSPWKCGASKMLQNGVEEGKCFYLSREGVTKNVEKFSFARRLPGHEFRTDGKNRLK